MTLLTRVQLMHGRQSLPRQASRQRWFDSLATVFKPITRISLWVCHLQTSLTFLQSAKADARLPIAPKIQGGLATCAQIPAAILINLHVELDLYSAQPYRRP